MVQKEMLSSLLSIVRLEFTSHDNQLSLIHFDVTVSLSLIDSTTNQPYTHAKLSFADNSSPSSFTIHSSRGHFHTIKPIVTFQNTSIKPTSFKFLLTLASTSQIPPILSRCSQKMREVIGEENQEPIESWDGSQFIFMRVLSGDVEVVMSGKKGEGSTSTLKGEFRFFATFLSPLLSIYDRHLLEIVY